MDARTGNGRVTQVAVICLFAIGLMCAVANSVDGGLRDFWDAALPWVSTGLALALLAAAMGPTKAG